MLYASRQDCRSSLFHAPGFMSKTAARWLGCAFIAISLLGGGLQDSKGELIIDVTEVGGDVIMTWNGIIGDSGAADGTASVFQTPRVVPTYPVFNAGQSPGGDYYVGTFQTFGAGGATLATTTNNNGNPFFLLQFSDAFGIPDPTFNALHVQAGTDLSTQVFSGSMTFASTSLSSMQIAPLSSPITIWQSDTGVGSITLSSQPAVPEPTTALGLLGLVTSAFFRRRRRLLG